MANKSFTESLLGKLKHIPKGKSLLRTPVGKPTTILRNGKELIAQGKIIRKKVVLKKTLNQNFKKPSVIKKRTNSPLHIAFDCSPDEYNWEDDPIYANLNKPSPIEKRVDRLDISGIQISDSVEPIRFGPLPPIPSKRIQKSRPKSKDDCPSGSSSTETEENTITMSDFNLNEFNCNIPEFRGKSEEVDVFIRRCDELQSDLNENGRRTFFRKLVYKLSGDAFELFENRQFGNWTEFRNVLQAKYKGKTSLINLYSELKVMRQNQNESVENYADRIKMLLNRMKKTVIEEDPNVEVRRYLSVQHDKMVKRTFKEGLSNTLQLRVVAGGPSLSLDEMIALAIEEEPFVKSWSNINPIKQYDRINSTAVPIKIKREPTECSFCKKKGHTYDECRTKLLPRVECSFCHQIGHGIDQCYKKGNFKQEVVCFKCNERGHYATACPSSSSNKPTTKTTKEQNGRNRVHFMGSEKNKKQAKNPFSKNSSHQTREKSVSRLEVETESHH